MFKSLFFRRLYIPFLLVVFAVAAIIGVIGAYRLHEAAISQARTLLRQTETLVADLLRKDIAVPNTPELRAEVARVASLLNCRITVIDADGTVVADSEANPDTMVSHRARPEIIQAFTTGQGWDIRYSETVHSNLLYYASKIDVDGKPLYLRLAIHISDLEQGLRQLYTNIAIATGASLLGAAIVAYYIARRQARPIVEVTQFADAVARGELDRRIIRTDPGELGILARSLNSMADSFSQFLRETERDKAELRTILASMSEGIIATGSAKRILLVNDAAGRLLNFDTATAQDKAVWEIIRHDQIIRAVDEVIASGQPRQLIFSPQPGIQLEITVSPFDHNSSTDLRGIIIVARDVTQAMRYQDLRKEFVANVSHELRTPLTVIKGFVETLRDGAADDPHKRDEYLATIERHTNQLGNLVADLLELSKLENQPSVPRKSPVDLNGTVRRVIDLLHTPLNAKQQTIDVNLPPAPPPLVGNSDYIDRAVINLLDNAIKYTPNGGHIQITVGSEGGFAFVEVADNGLGIPAEDLPRIFERFYRVDRSRSREMGGTGLGLAIVKHIAQAHGGRVEVASELNNGSRFRLLLPVAVGLQ